MHYAFALLHLHCITLFSVVYSFLFYFYFYFYFISISILCICIINRNRNRNRIEGDSVFRIHHSLFSILSFRISLVHNRCIHTMCKYIVYTRENRFAYTCMHTYLVRSAMWHRMHSYLVLTQNALHWLKRWCVDFQNPNLRTYMLADYLSNYIQHPTQKMDYGIFNQVIGREVDQVWWGTRTGEIYI